MPPNLPRVRRCSHTNMAKSYRSTPLHAGRVQARNRRSRVQMKTRLEASRGSRTLKILSRLVCFIRVSNYLLSLTDNVLRAGSLRIYTVPGMATYLSCGSVIRPVLAKSECWCVDGATKFVLRISQYQFYRIELPNATEDDVNKAEQLKKVLANLLQYETTPCPFQRNFVIDLPEARKTPVRRRPWTPYVQAGPVLDTTTTELDQDSSDEYVTAASEMSTVDDTDDGSENERKSKKAAHTRLSAGLSNYRRTGRATTAPIHVEVKAYLPVGFGTSLFATPDMTSKSVGPAPSVESFHTALSPLPPSPPYSNPPSPSLPGAEIIDLPRRRLHRRDISEITISADGPKSWDSIQTSRHQTRNDHPSLPQTPTPVCNRSGSSRQREYSPMPAPDNLYYPSPKASGYHFTTAVLQKTCSILLGPPVQLVALMLNIAKTITSEASGAIPAGSGKGGRVPGHFEHSDTDGTGDDMSDEDDFGIPLRRLRPRTTRMDPVDQSSDVD